MAALLAAPDPDAWTGRRDRALLMLAVQTGLRASELLGLRCEDIIVGPSSYVHCQGKGRKLVSVRSATRWLWREVCLVRRSGGVTPIQSFTHAVQVPRQQFVDTSDRMVSDTFEDFAQIILGIESV